MPTSPTSVSPVREVLPNGAVVIVKSARTTPAVAINMEIQAGSAFDPPASHGRAYFLSRVIDRGTARRSTDAIAEALDLRGVALSISVTRQRMTLACDCLIEDFDAVLELIVDVVREATCPETEITKRRGDIVTAIRRDHDSAFVTASDTVMELLYGRHHPYGWRAKGTIDTVERIGRSSLLELHRTRFVPSGTSLAIVGDVSPESALAAATRVLSNWHAEPAGELVMPQLPATSGRRFVEVPLPGKVQSDIAYGFTTITRTDPRYYAFRIMNNVLGQYGLGGRLGDSIRERQGMAYYVFSSLDANVAPGPLVVRAGVNPSNIARALQSIDEEIGKMATDGVTARELAESQQFLIGSIPRILETNAAIATFLQTVEQFDLGLDYDVQLPDLLSAVTCDNVRAAAHCTLSPDLATIAVAGPPLGRSAPVARESR